MKTIILTNGMKALVDDADYSHLSAFTWTAKTNASQVIYAGRYLPWSQRIRQLMQHEIMGKPPVGKMWDHADRNGLNNQRSNLRLATKAQNNFNQGVRKDNRSGRRGICFDRETGKWRAYLDFKGKKVYVGRFHSLKEAETERRLKAEELYGEFAPK